MADSSLDHMWMKKRVGGEFTIDEGAMTECGPPFVQSHQKFGTKAPREMISFSRFAERARREFFFFQARLATAVKKS